MGSGKVLGLWKVPVRSRTGLVEFWAGSGAGFKKVLGYKGLAGEQVF